MFAHGWTLSLRHGPYQTRTGLQLNTLFRCHDGAQFLGCLHLLVLRQHLEYLIFEIIVLNLVQVDWLAPVEFHYRAG